MSTYIPALRRQWPLLAVGAVVALIAALATIFQLPSFERREAPTYTARARLLVTGVDAPYIRTSVTRASERQREEGSGGPTQEVTSGGTTILQTGPPDVTAYIRAANLYPLLVESDQVKAERQRLFGSTEGTVTANAIYAVSTPSRFTPSEVPVIQVFGTAPSGPESVALTRQTASAFVSWMKRQQTASGIPTKQRIRLQEIERPTAALPSATASPLLAPIAFIVVASAFVLLALLVDRLRTPRVEAAATASGAADAPDATIGSTTANGDPGRTTTGSPRTTKTLRL